MRNVADTVFYSSFIGMMESLSIPWGIKDIQSRHVYMNDAAYKFTGTPSNFEIEGALDSEFPVRWAECASQLQEHDRRTGESLDMVTVIETHFWDEKNYMTPYLCEKMPIFNNERRCIGIIWNAKPLSSLSVMNFITKKKPSVMTTSIPGAAFTTSELDVIFLLCRRFTAKEISKAYGVSPKTIENKIYTIYQKAGVNSLRQFEEYCTLNNLDNYIPARIIKAGLSFL